MLNQCNRLRFWLLLLAFSPSLAGCSYLVERGNDLRDVLTFAVEDQGVHVGLQALPLVMGAGYADGSGYGLRNGMAGAYDYSEFSLGVMGRKTFSADEPGRASKSCDIVWATPLFLTQGPLRYFSVGHSDPVCPWNIEGAISLGFGLRVGLNLAELVDFTIGLTGFDLLQDDFGRILHAKAMAE
jgi:hypothetical protein